MQNTIRQERIVELERNISGKIEQEKLNNLVKSLLEKGVPDSELMGIKTFEELHARFNKHPRIEYEYAFIEATAEYVMRNYGLSVPQRVLLNIVTTREAVSQIGEDISSDPDYLKFCVSRIKSDPAYQALTLLWEAIYDNEGNLSGFWEDTEETGKELADTFVSDTQESFLYRRKLLNEQSWESIPCDMTMEEQYKLLARITKAPEDIQKQILQEVCLILPSYFGADFSWSQAQEIVDRLFPVVEQETPMESIQVFHRRVMAEVLQNRR